MQLSDLQGVGVHLTRSDISVIDKIAFREGTSRAGWIRRLIRAEIERLATATPASEAA